MRVATIFTQFSGFGLAITAAAALQPPKRRPIMFRDIILWLAGVRFVIIFCIFFGVFH
jgi:hypothetical protein